LLFSHRFVTLSSPLPRSAAAAGGDPVTGRVSPLPSLPLPTGIPFPYTSRISMSPKQPWRPRSSALHLYRVLPSHALVACMEPPGTG
ncbi:unnamed protein product, partial [Urochloa humidicola]